MQLDKYKFNYRYLYPLLALLLYFQFALLLIHSLQLKFAFFNLKLSSYFLLFIFLAEAVIRFNAALSIEIPRLIFLGEVLLYFLLLLFLNGQYQGLNSLLSIKLVELYLFTLLSIFIWLQLNELTAFFFIFNQDCVKIFDHSDSVNNLDEFRRLLDYPLIWPKIKHKIILLNLGLLICWALVETLQPTIILLTISFLITEIFLLASAYFTKKTIDWQVNGIKEFSTIKQGWIKFLILLISIAFLFSALMPANYQLLPMNKIGGWLNSNLEFKSNLAPNRTSPKLTNNFSSQVKQAAKKPSSLLILFYLAIEILLVFLVGLLILLLIIFLFKSELSKFKNLSQFTRAFLAFIKNIIQLVSLSLKKINFKIKATWQQKQKQLKTRQLNNQEIKELQFEQIKAGDSSVISQIYFALLKLLAWQGIKKDNTLTPYEFSEQLEVDNSILQEIKLLTTLFVESSYSNHSLSKQIINSASQSWQRIKNKF
jgi:hypothetical protein